MRTPPRTPNAIVDMLREEARFWMPPQPLHFIGRDEIVTFDNFPNFGRPEIWCDR